MPKKPSASSRTPKSRWRSQDCRSRRQWTVAPAAGQRIVELGRQAERAISGSGAEGALLLSKLAGMSWDTTRAIIYAQHRECGIASQDVDRAFGNFARMNQDTARRILDFKVRAKPPAAMAQAG